MLSKGSNQDPGKRITSALPCWALVLCVLFAVVNPLINLSDQVFSAEPADEELLTGEPFVYSLEPDERGGKAYKLVYLVGVGLDVFWSFKTDFAANFLLSHKYIENHRFVRREKNTVITETKYSSNPNATFRWRTMVSPSSYRLDFALENPEECGQEFHYGHIQLEALGQQRTKVTQVAYFDFLGVSLWVHWPWAGGMTEFLEYTAQWEQETVLRLKERYFRKAGREKQ